MLTYNYVEALHWKNQDILVFYFKHRMEIGAAHDEKVGCNTVEYTTALLCPDWFCFLRHGIIKNYSPKWRWLAVDKINI